MEQSDLIRRAEQYLAAEQDTRFSDEVRTLIDAGDWDEIEDRFYTDLEFGTGGLRGVIGGGFNRMNPFVVARATTGLARYVLEAGDAGPDGKRAAVISYDSRRYSREFAGIVARVFAGHGITAYLFSALRPTPELSFAVRMLEASVGVMVTASHNPPQYNGYKVYWSDGAQVVEPHDRAIIERVMAVTADDIRIADSDEARREGLLREIDRDVDDAFVAMVKRQSVEPALLAERGGEVTAVYTPLHGTGAMMVERVLGELGVTVVTVPEQREPDGEFPTVASPNPEEGAALEMAIALGRRRKADIVLGTDPDADRLGIAVPDGDDFRLITGNQLGVLLVDYIFGRRTELGTLPAKPVFVTTIVTTGMQRRIAEHYGASVEETLTGFKHIATVMRRLEAHPSDGTFIMGDEESYGYLIGTEVRDKDSISATMLTIEMALHWRRSGLSVLDRLRALWHEFGYWEESTISRYFEGVSGKATMDAMMERLRREPPATFGGAKVERMLDISDNTLRDPATGASQPGPGLPRSNVLQFFLDSGATVSARPSGTEPKIKFYASCHSEAGLPLEEARRAVRAQIERIEVDIETIIAGAAQ